MIPADAAIENIRMLDILSTRLRSGWLYFSNIKLRQSIRNDMTYTFKIK